MAAPGALTDALTTPTAAVILIALSTLAVYSATFNYPFVFDDDLYIVGNDRLHHLGSFIYDSGLGGTRYATMLTFALNYAIGGADPFGFHLVNTAIHAVNGVLLWALLTLLLKTPAMKGDGASGEGENPARRFIPIGAALIFIVHPINTQAVVYITQRFASLAALFYLLALVLYLKARLSGVNRGRLASPALYWAALAAAIVAMKAKEISFTLPVVLVIMEATFFKAARGWGGIRGRLLLTVPFLATMAIIPLTMLTASAGVDEELRALKLEEFTSLSRYNYFITEMRVIVTYLRLLVFPVAQNLYYDYPVYESLFQLPVLLSTLFLAALFAGAALLFYRSIIKEEGGGGKLALVASFGALWFFVTLSVESSVVPIWDVIFEHRLYLPSMGAAMALSAGVVIGAERWAASGSGAAPGNAATKTALVVLIAVTVPLAAVAYKRTDVWKEQVTLWEDVVNKSPMKAAAHYNLGNGYHGAGRYEEAAGEFREAIALSPRHSMAHTNLGISLMRLGKTGEAEEAYLRSIEFWPKKAKAHYNLGNLYAAEGEAERAIGEYLATVEIDPDNVNAHNNMAIIHAAMGERNKAIEGFRRVAALEPENPDAHYNLALALRDGGLPADAAASAARALALDPAFEEARRMIEEAGEEADKAAPD